MRQRIIRRTLQGRMAPAGHGPALELLALLLQSSAGGLTPPLQAQVGSASGVDLTSLKTHATSFAMLCCSARPATAEVCSQHPAW